jgi:cobalt-zinc-cadmium resistance protein CzcA
LILHILSGISEPVVEPPLLPILMLGGVEGKMFKPMAVTVLFALAASLVIAMTLMPVLAYYAFRRGHTEKHPWLMRKLSNYYRMSFLGH